MPGYFIIIRTFSPTLRRMLLAQGFNGIGMGIFAVLLNLYLKAGGLGEDHIGRLLAYKSFAAAFSSIFWGWLADRTGRKSTYLCGIFCVGTGFSLLTASGDPAWYWLAAVICGLGEGAEMVSVQPFLQENSRPGQRSYVFSLNFSLNLFMSIFAGFVAGWLPWGLRASGLVGVGGEVPALRLTMAAGIGFVILASLPVLLIPSGRPSSSVTEGKPVSPGSEPPPPLSAVAGVIAKFVLTSAMIGCGAGLIVPFFNLYFLDWVGAGVPEIGTIFAFGQFGTAVGGFLTPWIIRRFGFVGGVVGTQLLSLPFMVIMANTHGMLLCSASFWFRQAFMNMGVPIRQEMLMNLVPAQYRARASAVDSMSWNLAWAFSMLFSGALIRDRGYDFCLLVTTFLYLSSSLVYFSFFRSYAPPRIESKRQEAA